MYVEAGIGVVRNNKTTNCVCKAQKRSYQLFHNAITFRINLKKRKKSAFLQNGKKTFLR